MSSHFTGVVKKLLFHLAADKCWTGFFYIGCRPGTRYTPCPFGQGNDYISARMIFECIINSLYLLYLLNYYPVSS